jgi:hypothetical protein
MIVVVVVDVVAAAWHRSVSVGLCRDLILLLLFFVVVVVKVEKKKTDPPGDCIFVSVTGIESRGSKVTG